MSHFTVAVFTKPDGLSVVELLAKFDKNIEMEPYIALTKEQVIEESKNINKKYEATTYAEYLKDPIAYAEKYHHNSPHIEYLKNTFPKMLKMTDEEHYQHYIRDSTTDENGNLLSTYNPNSKWDWYSIGGRWSNFLKLKNGLCADSALLSDVDFFFDSKDKSFVTFAVILPDGTWHQRGDMGWWGVATDIKDDWYDTYKEKFLDTANSNWTITIVDCHI